MMQPANIKKNFSKEKRFTLSFNSCGMIDLKFCHHMIQKIDLPFLVICFMSREMCRSKGLSGMQAEKIIFLHGKYPMEA